MAAIATGQISIVDYNDLPSLTAFITTTSPKTQIFDPPTNAYVPNWTSAPPTLTPSLYVSTSGTTEKIASAKSVRWFDSIAPTTALTTTGPYTVTGSTLKISQNIMTGNTYSKTFICEIIYRDPISETDLPIRADFVFTRADNGETGPIGKSAISAILSNDSDVIPTDVNGNSGNFNGAVSTMTIYEGATDVSSAWTVVAGTPVGLTGTLSGKTYTVTAMAADTAYVDLVASRSGYSSITRRFALSKSKQGAAGTTPTLYRLITSAGAIQKSISGVYNPATITVSGKSQTGSGAINNYSGRFIIEETTDGTTWPSTPKYTATTDAASYTYTPTAGIKAARVKFYLAGGTTTLLDEQTIPVVADGQTGAAGADAVLVTAYAPDGNLFKNDLISSLTATSEVYKGANLVTSGVTYQWFVQKAGQADGGAGAGYLLLTDTNKATYGITSAINTSNITITPDGVLNLAVFKVKATYSGKAYYDTIIFYDQTDPISVYVSSSNGNIFKNGEVSSRLSVKLTQNGEEIDPLLPDSATVGYKYTYTWTKFKADGTQDTTFGTSGKKLGKWIDIGEADVQQKAVFNVEIS